MRLGADLKLYSGFAAAIALMMRAHRELRVVLVALTGTTMILFLILYLKRYHSSQFYVNQRSKDYIITK